MTDHIEAARKVLDEVFTPDIRYCSGGASNADRASALDSASLLRTGIEQRALKACEEYAENYEATLPVRIQYSSAARGVLKRVMQMVYDDLRWVRAALDGLGEKKA